MPYFKKTIATEHGSIEFVFSRIYTSEGMQYHVAIEDVFSKKSLVFQMKDTQGNWRIVQKPGTPAWIMDLENDLSNAIVDHLLGID